MRRRTEAAITGTYLVRQKAYWRLRRSHARLRLSAPVINVTENAPTASQNVSHSVGSPP